MPTPSLIQIHGVALAGIPIQAPTLMGRPPSARMTFFEHFKPRYD